MHLKPQVVYSTKTHGLHVCTAFACNETHGVGFGDENMNLVQIKEQMKLIGTKKKFDPNHLDTYAQFLRVKSECGLHFRGSGVVVLPHSKNVVVRRTAPTSRVLRSKAEKQSFAFVPTQARTVAKVRESARIPKEDAQSQREKIVRFLLQIVTGNINLDKRDLVERVSFGTNGLHNDIILFNAIARIVAPLMISTDASFTTEPLIAQNVSAISSTYRGDPRLYHLLQVVGRNKHAVGLSSLLRYLEGDVKSKESTTAFELLYPQIQMLRFLVSDAHPIDPHINSFGDIRSPLGDNTIVTAPSSFSLRDVMNKRLSTITPGKIELMQILTLNTDYYTTQILSILLAVFNNLETLTKMDLGNLVKAINDSRVIATAPNDTSVDLEYIIKNMDSETADRIIRESQQISVFVSNRERIEYIRGNTDAVNNIATQGEIDTADNYVDTIRAVVEALQEE